MNLYTIPLSRSVKQILMMIADAVMIVLALAFSFALLGKDFFGQDQRFYFYLSLLFFFSGLRRMLPRFSLLKSIQKLYPRVNAA